MSFAYERAMFSDSDLEKFAVTFACGVRVTVSPYFIVAVTPASIPTFESTVFFTSDARVNFSLTW